MSDVTPSANKYAMTALSERRAEMSDELTRLEQQVRRVTASVVHQARRGAEKSRHGGDKGIDHQ